MNETLIYIAMLLSGAYLLGKEENLFLYFVGGALIVLALDGSKLF